MANGLIDREKSSPDIDVFSEFHNISTITTPISIPLRQKDIRER